MSTFGRYTLVRRVGTGGMAEIWKAKAQGPAGFEKILAIKKVLPHLAEDEEFIDMFIAEAKLVATLVHPNIVQVFDFGQVGKRDYFIAMEYVGGANLAMILRRLGEKGARLPLEVSLYLVAEACKGLGYAHNATDMGGRRLTIVHRDVSPQNILISFGGEVKVTDFGIAKVTSALSQTAAGHVRGKLAYMSPEQAATAPLDNRSDLFSLGLVLFELTTGKRLFGGSSGSEIFAKVANFKMPAEEDIGHLPYKLKQIVSTALQADPEERFQDASEMEQALQSALGPEGIVQARHALASIVQRLFDEERRMEMMPDPVSGPIPDAQQEMATTANPSGEYMASAGAMSAVPREPELAKPTTSPSGLTLAPSAVRPIPGAAVLPAGPSVVQVQSGGHAKVVTERQGRGNGLTITMILGFIVAVALLAFTGGKYISRNDLTITTPFPTSTPTNVVVIPSEVIPTVTPVVAATATPVATVRVQPTPFPATPRPTPTRVVVVSTPRPTPTPVAVAGSAHLTVNAKPWVQVFLDGKQLTAETPLRREKIPAGRHTLRLVNPGLKFSVERIVTVKADSEIDVFVDVGKGTVTFK